MEPFCYTQLPSKDSFRIILLEPGQADDQLRCRLQVHRVATAPAYDALSYVWGDPSRSLPLVSDGKQLLITAALEAALRRLRLPETRLALWVDQLCINQADLDERTQQVQLMRDIYSRASKVIVWLGSDDDNQAASARDLVRRIDAVWDDHIDTLRFPSDEELAKRRLPPQDAACWKDLEAMLAAPYFRRIWVVQECRLASDLLVVWGSQQIPWLEFYHTYFWVASNSATDSPGLSLSINSEILFSSSNCPDPGFSDDFDWLGILKATRFLEATDPRDKVFALLGLLGDKGALVTPDYREPPLRVFARFAARMVSAMDSLRLLSFAPLARDVESPRWAPRWEWDRHGAMTYKPFEHYQFSASLALRPVTKPSMSRWDVLALKGVSVDVIEATTAPLEGGLVDTSGNLLNEAWELVQSKKTLLQSRYAETYGLIVAFAWTITAGQALYPHILMYKPAEHEHLLDFAAYQVDHVLRMMEKDDDSLKEGGCLRSTMDLAHLAYRAYNHLSEKGTQAEPLAEEWATWIRETMHWAHGDKSTAESACALFDKLGVDADAQLRYQSMMGIVTPWRRLFVTKEGYMGLAAHGIQPGDEICVLFGGATPYVVRPTGVEGEYLFMGECYVHGLMDGEAVLRWERGESCEQWFHLR